MGCRLPEINDLAQRIVAGKLWPFDASVMQSRYLVGRVPGTADASDKFPAKWLLANLNSKAVQIAQSREFVSEYGLFEFLRQR